MTSSPLRCHLLIGPAASGKSTLAKVLAECTNATVLSPDAIRAELYGDAADQGCWSEIEPLLHQQLKDAVTAGRPVIVDATHTQRPWRLAILQGFDLPEPVQWIGWWLTTPLEQCLAWNRQRDRQVDEDVIRRQHGCLPNAVYELPKALEKKLPADPDQRRLKLKSLEEQFLGRQRNLFREEGFAQIVAINPASCDVSDGDQIKGLLDRLDLAITMTRCRRSTIVLHRYSRLLDLERLIFLIRLLLEFPGVDLADVTVEQELRASFRYNPKAPLPDDEDPSFATRAAYALHHRHGACYGDEDAVAEDLQWLLDQKFVTLADLPLRGPVKPGRAKDHTRELHKYGSGFPTAADRSVFQRQFGLLRHLIHNPFDAPSEHSPKPYTNLQDLNRLTALIRLLLLVFKQDQDQDNRPVKRNKKKTVVDPDDNARAWDLEILRRSSKTHPRHKARPSFATRLAFVLRHRHPKQPGYGDRHAIAGDLHWLREQKEKPKNSEKRKATNQRNPHSALSRQQSPSKAAMNNSGSGQPAGGLQPKVADIQADQFGGLLEKLFETVLEEVFNHDPPPSPWMQKLETTDPKNSSEQKGVNKKKRQRSSPPSLRVHLIQRLAELNVADYTNIRESYSKQLLATAEPQVRTLDKDLELFIKGYGFTTILQQDHGAF